jgi:hypothetical protein
MLFDAIAREAYGTRFQWSDYNRVQWDKFVNLEIGGDGGSCAFSLEPDGKYNNHAGDLMAFKGMFVGVPVGYFPYHIGPLGPADLDPAFARAISKAGYARTE